MCDNDGMSSAVVRNEADILSRVISANKEDFPPAMVDLILGFNFPKEDRERMDELALKAREGTLTDEEEAEINAYERVGHFLSALQSKARASLNRDQAPPA